MSKRAAGGRNAVIQARQTRKQMRDQARTRKQRRLAARIGELRWR